MTAPGADLTGRVALVTGASRGQGRSHAIAMARSGADVIVTDLGQDLDTVPYGLGTLDELEETAALVRETGRHALPLAADVRSQQQLDDAVAAGMDRFGRLDIVCANAGIFSPAPSVEMTEQQWQDTLDINLTGVWHTAKAAIPAIVKGGRGGSMIFTGSVASFKGIPGNIAYVATKHAVLGVVRTLAIELAPHGIRVNAVNPTNVATGMILNESLYRLFRPDLEEPELGDVQHLLQDFNTLPVPWVESEDVSAAVVWLAADTSRYVTGIALPVDAGCLLK